MSASSEAVVASRTGASNFSQLDGGCADGAEHVLLAVGLDLLAGQRIARLAFLGRETDYVVVAQRHDFTGD